jgi:hypothetical protein
VKSETSDEEELSKIFVIIGFIIFMLTSLFLFCSKENKEEDPSTICMKKICPIGSYPSYVHKPIRCICEAPAK